MRILDTDLGGIVRLAFSGDGRFLLATAANHTLAVLDPATGDVVRRIDGCLTQPAAISPDGGWVAAFAPDLTIFPTDGRPPTRFERPVFVGGLAFTPDGKSLAAVPNGTGYGRGGPPVGLARWAAPSWQPQPGYDFFPRFDRLAYSPDGEYLAGIKSTRLEVRYARSGGQHASASPAELGGFAHRRDFGTPDGRLHLSFSPRGDFVLFGWTDALHVMDAVAGKVAKRALTAGPAVTRDAAFTADGRRIGAVGDDGSVRFWEAGTWAPAGRFDWGLGPLRAVAFAPAGGPGACGTADGRVVLFDVDD